MLSCGRGTRQREAAPFLKPLVSLMAFLLLGGFVPANAQDLASPPGGQPTATSDQEGLAARAGTIPLDQLLQEMKASYRKIRSYQADFEQVSRTRSFQATKRSWGKVYFRKPDNMRWTYIGPEKREIYIKGQELTIFLPEREQIIRQPLAEVLPGMAPAGFFLDADALLRLFHVSLVASNEDQDNAYCLQLVPKERGKVSVEKVLLWVRKGDFLPIRSESQDLFGNETSVSFRNARTNVPLDHDMFQPDVPPDVEMLDGGP